MVRLTSEKSKGRNSSNSDSDDDTLYTILCKIKGINETRTNGDFHYRHKNFKPRTQNWNHRPFYKKQYNNNKFRNYYLRRPKIETQALKYQNTNSEKNDNEEKSVINNSKEITVKSQSESDSTKTCDTSDVLDINISKEMFFKVLKMNVVDEISTDKTCKKKEITTKENNDVCMEFENFLKEVDDSSSKTKSDKPKESENTLILSDISNDSLENSDISTVNNHSKNSNKEKEKLSSNEEDDKIENKQTETNLGKEDIFIMKEMKNTESDEETDILSQKESEINANLFDIDTKKSYLSNRYMDNLNVVDMDVSNSPVKGNIKRKMYDSDTEDKVPKKSKKISPTLDEQELRENCDDIIEDVELILSTDHAKNPKKKIVHRRHTFNSVTIPKRIERNFSLDENSNININHQTKNEKQDDNDELLNLLDEKIHKDPRIKHSNIFKNDIQNKSSSINKNIAETIARSKEKSTLKEYIRNFNEKTATPPPYMKDDPLRFSYKNSCKNRINELFGTDSESEFEEKDDSKYKQEPKKKIEVVNSSSKNKKRKVQKERNSIISDNKDKIKTTNKKSSSKKQNHKSLTTNYPTQSILEESKFHHSEDLSQEKPEEVQKERNSVISDNKDKIKTLTNTKSSSKKHNHKPLTINYPTESILPEIKFHHSEKLSQKKPEEVSVNFFYQEDFSCYIYTTEENIPTLTTEKVFQDTTKYKMIINPKDEIIDLTVDPDGLEIEELTGKLFAKTEGERKELVEIADKQQTVTLYRSDETLNDTLDVQATVALVLPKADNAVKALEKLFDEKQTTQNESEEPLPKCVSADLLTKNIVENTEVSEKSAPNDNTIVLRKETNTNVKEINKRDYVVIESTAPTESSILTEPTNPAEPTLPTESTSPTDPSLNKSQGVHNYTTLALLISPYVYLTFQLTMNCHIFTEGFKKLEAFGNMYMLSLQLFETYKRENIKMLSVAMHRQIKCENIPYYMTDFKFLLENVSLHISSKFEKNCLTLAQVYMYMNLLVETLPFDSEMTRFLNAFYYNIKTTAECIKEKRTKAVLEQQFKTIKSQILIYKKLAEKTHRMLQQNQNRGPPNVTLGYHVPMETSRQNVNVLQNISLLNSNRQEQNMSANRQEQNMSANRQEQNMSANRREQNISLLNSNRQEQNMSANRQEQNMSVNISKSQPMNLTFRKPPSYVQSMHLIVPQISQNPGVPSHHRMPPQVQFVPSNIQAKSGGTSQVIQNTNGQFRMSNTVQPSTQCTQNVTKRQPYSQYTETPVNRSSPQSLNSQNITLTRLLTGAPGSALLNIPSQAAGVQCSITSTQHTAPRQLVFSFANQPNQYVPQITHFTASSHPQINTNSSQRQQNVQLNVASSHQTTQRQSFQFNEGQVPNPINSVNLQQLVEKTVDTTVNTTKDTCMRSDNFKIRLPLSEPYKTDSSKETVAAETTSENENRDHIERDETESTNTSSESLVTLKKELPFTENEVIDLTWLDDVDICSEIEACPIKLEKTESINEEVSEESESEIRIASPADSGIASPPMQVSMNEIILSDRLCICGRKAVFLCVYCTYAMYCSENCQFVHWPYHKNMCKKNKFKKIQYIN